MRSRIIGIGPVLCLTVVSCKSGPKPVTEARKVYSAPPTGTGVIRPSAALELNKQTTAESAAKADRIVLARAAGTRVSQSRGNIFTYIDFSVSELVKGKMSGKTFSLRLLGGRLGGVEIAGPLDGEFVAGSEYILFLGKDNADGYPTLNPQVIFSVHEDPQHKRKIATPGPSGLKLYRAGTKKEISYTEDAAYADDLLYSLKIAGGGR
jgi:hypothetical protein